MSPSRENVQPWSPGRLGIDQLIQDLVPVAVMLVSAFAGSDAASGQIVSPLDDFGDASEEMSSEVESLDDWISYLQQRAISFENLDPDLLAQVPGIERSDIDAILAFRLDHGVLGSLSELDDIEGLTTTAKRVLRVILVIPNKNADPSEPAQSSIGIRITTTRTWNGPGTSDNAGSPLRRTLHIRGQFGAFTGALVAQNEPYEHWMWRLKENYYGFDHVAGFVTYGQVDSPYHVIVGDFTVDTGQGLMQARPFGTRLSATSPWQVLRSWSGISGYSGSTRQRTFRGMAVTVKPTRYFLAQVFVSRARPDTRALPNDVLPVSVHGPPIGVDAAPPIPSTEFTLVQSDQHITEEQFTRRQNARMGTIGGRLEWNRASIRVGLQYAATEFDRLIRLLPDRKAETTYKYASLFWSLSHRSWTSRGEMLFSRSPSIIAGLAFRPSTTARLSLLVRSYTRTASVLFGKPFSFKNRTPVQTGILLSAGFRIGRRVSVAMSYDAYSATGSSETYFIPLEKDDIRVNAAIAVAKYLDLDLSVRMSASRSVTAKIHASGTTWSESVINRISQLSALLSVHASDRLTTRTRVDVNHGCEDAIRAATGFHIGQTVSMQLQSGVSITAQRSLYRAPGILNRFYIYEPGLQGQISAPGLQGAGSRSSLLITIGWIRRSYLQLNYSVSSKDTVYEYSSTEGLSAKPMVQSSVGLQMRVRL